MQKKGWNKAVVAGARKSATIAFHMLKSHEPYRYAGIDRTRVKLRRIRMATTGERVYMPRYDSQKETPAENVLVRHVPPLADVYEKEGLPPAKSVDELSEGEKRFLQEAGLLDRFRQRETVRTIYTPKPSSRSSE